jgi:hypothetical protein
MARYMAGDANASPSGTARSDKAGRAPGGGI